VIARSCSIASLFFLKISLFPGKKQGLSDHLLPIASNRQPPTRSNRERFSTQLLERGPDSIREWSRRSSIGLCYRNSAFAAASLVMLAAAN
jgi:hypothetical protein